MCGGLQGFFWGRAQESHGISQQLRTTYLTCIARFAHVAVKPASEHGDILGCICG
jgi:hypothetical protein